MKALFVIFGIIAIIAFVVFKNEYDKEQPADKKMMIALVTMVISAVLAFGMLISDCTCGSSSGSAWSQLSDDEKDWYHNNYGDGKSNAYDKAINDYKK